MSWIRPQRAKDTNFNSRFETGHRVWPIPRHALLPRALNISVCYDLINASRKVSLQMCGRGNIVDVVVKSEYDFQKGPPFPRAEALTEKPI